MLGHQALFCLLAGLWAQTCKHAASGAQGEGVGWRRQGSGLWLSPGCPPSPKGSDSLDSNVPTVVPKVVGSGGLPLIPGVPSTAFLIPPEPRAAGGGREGRREQEGGRSARSAAALWMAV